MPAFNFHLDPKPTTMIVTARALPSHHPFTSTFVAPVETTLSLSGAITFPFGVPASGALALPVRADSGHCDDGGANGIGTSNLPPEQGGTAPGQAKKTCGTSSATASTSTTTAQAASGATQSLVLAQSPTSTALLSLIQPTATSRGLDASQPTQGSQSASANGPDTSIGGQLSSNTQSLDLQETTPGSDTPSFPLSPTEPVFESSDPTANPLTTSTPPASTHTHHRSSSGTAAATPASGLSTGSWIGIALGVFAGAAVLLAGAVLLFLSIRNRRTRRGGRRDSCSAASTQSSTATEKRRLRPGSESCEGSQSGHGTLSSTWSWFGTLPIGSESDLYEDGCGDGHGCGYEDTRPSSVNTRTRDNMDPDPDPFRRGGALSTDRLEDGVGNGYSRPRTPASPRASSLHPTAPQLHVEREWDVPGASRSEP